METSPVPALSYKNQLLDHPPKKKKKNQNRLLEALS